MLPDDTSLGDTLPDGAKPKENKQCLVQKGTEELASRVRTRDADFAGSPAGSHSGASKREETPPHSSPSHLQTHVDENQNCIPDVYASANSAAAPDPSAPVLLLLSGSPRCRTCVSLIDIIERGAQEAGARTQRFLLCEKHIDPCIGCGGCSKTGNCILAGRKTTGGNFADDYLELISLLDSCDGLALVAPVYFSGPTAQLKALFDRFQPYWVRKYLLGYPFPKRRPAQLFVVGAGGDPHGFEPFVTISRSCLQIAGFELEKVGNFVGYKDPRDMPPRLSEEQISAMNAKELALAKEIIVNQAEFCRRALDSGRMLGRMLKNSSTAKFSDIKHHDGNFEHGQRNN